MNRQLSHHTLMACGCALQMDGIIITLAHCPLHRAAPGLMAACKKALDARLSKEIRWQLEAAIAEAEPKYAKAGEEKP